MSFFYLENCLLISGSSGFSFFAIENIQNLETTKNFQKLIFRGIKSIYLIFEHFSKHFLCSWQNSQGVAQSYQRALLKLSRSHFLLHFLLFQSARQSLLTNINKIDESILKKHDELITKTFLYGDNKFDLSCNKFLISSTIEFIVSTERLSNSLV